MQKAVQQASLENQTFIFHMNHNCTGFFKLFTLFGSVDHIITVPATENTFYGNILIQYLKSLCFFLMPSLFVTGQCEPPSIYPLSIPTVRVAGGLEWGSTDIGQEAGYTPGRSPVSANVSK